MVASIYDMTVSANPIPQNLTEPVSPSVSTVFSQPIDSKPSTVLVDSILIKPSKVFSFPVESEPSTIFSELDVQNISTILSEPVSNSLPEASNETISIDSVLLPNKKTLRIPDQNSSVSLNQSTIPIPTKLNKASKLHREVETSTNTIDSNITVVNTILDSKKVPVKNIKNFRKHRRRDSVPLVRGPFKKRTIRISKKNSKSLWEQLDNRSDIIQQTKINETQNSSTTENKFAPDHNVEFPFLIDDKIDYANYYYDDLDLIEISTEPIPPVKIELNDTPTDIEQLGTPKLNATFVTEDILPLTNLGKVKPREPRRLQSRKVSNEDFRFRNENILVTSETKSLKELKFRNIKANKSREVLREFPIFRKMKNKHSSKVNFSLHERLHNHLKNGAENNDTNITQPKTLALKNEDPIITLPSTEYNSTENISNYTNNIDEIIRTNVTFSTSRSQSVQEPVDQYPDILSLALLEEQLGVAPFGDAPFGEQPFGETPFGENPSGEKPLGIAPLGNQTVAPVINQTKPASNGKDEPEGRYHVQVTSPNGSVNGDYVVVDPVTRELNGVRYEAAIDVDPNVVQKALLNFLSLDPRLNPMKEKKPFQSEDEIIHEELEVNSTKLLEQPKINKLSLRR